MSWFIGGNYGVASTQKWVAILCSVNQTAVAANSLLTKFDTLGTGSAAHGITASNGLISLPTNTNANLQWEMQMHLALSWVSTATGTFRFYADPSGANTAIGIIKPAIDVTNTNINSYVTPAIAWQNGAGVIGARCVTTSSNATVVAANSYLLIREVAA